MKLHRSRISDKYGIKKCEKALEIMHGRGYNPKYTDSFVLKS